MLMERFSKEYSTNNTPKENLKMNIQNDTTGRKSYLMLNKDQAIAVL